MKECLCRFLKSCARVDSTKAEAEPSRAMTHIQNTAPGPPTAMAVATPARLPVPTRVATDTAKAWKEEMCLAPSCLPVESPSRRNISPTIRNCTPCVRRVKNKAQPTSTATRMYVQRKSLEVVTMRFNQPSAEKMSDIVFSLKL